MSCARAACAAQPRAARVLPRAKNLLKRPRALRVVLSCTGALFAHQPWEGTLQGLSLEHPMRPPTLQPRSRFVATSDRWRATSSRASRHMAAFVGLLLLGRGCQRSTATFARRQAGMSNRAPAVACTVGRGHEFSASVDTRQTSMSVTKQTTPEVDQNNDKAVLLLGILGALVFCLYVTATQGTNAGAEWMSCYVIEYTLSVDNLFLFIVIFKYFEINAELQRRVLNFGIAGAIIFRLLFVYLGAELLEQANVLILGFAAILIYASISGLLKSEEDETESGMENNAILQNIRRIMEVSPRLDGDKFFTRIAGKTVATPLFLCLLVLELSDVVFATDSVPAIRGITQDPFIAYTSSIFAVFGMRSLFFLLRDAMAEFAYLERAVNVVLGFIGSKIVVEYFEIVDIPTLWSLGIVLTILIGGLILSMQEATTSTPQDGCEGVGKYTASSFS